MPRTFFRPIADRELTTAPSVQALYMEAREEGLATVTPSAFRGLVALAFRLAPRHERGAMLRRLILFQAWAMVTDEDRERGRVFAVEMPPTGYPETEEQHQVAALLHARELDYLLFFDQYCFEPERW